MSYYKRYGALGDDSSVVYSTATYNSPDFVRIEAGQLTSAFNTFGQDPLTYGLTPADIYRTYPNTPVTFAQTLYEFWQNALAAGKSQWGDSAFPQADAALAKSYNAMYGNANRTMGGQFAYLGYQLDGPECVAFWEGLSKVAIELGSKDFTVTLAEKVEAFLSGAVQGAQNVIQIAADAAKGIAAGVTDFATIVNWVVIGGVAIAAYWYVLRPMMEKRKQ